MNGFKIFALLLISAFITTAAQTHRFIYEYTFAKDSLNRQKTVTEIMNLDITAAESYFYSDANAKADSIVESAAFKANQNFNDARFGEVSEVVIKKYPEMHTTSFTRVGNTISYKRMKAFGTGK